MATAELLLHPVRLRIVQAFLGDRALTTSQLRLSLGTCRRRASIDTSRRLVNGGVLTAVAERRVRGAVERTYVMRAATARIGAGGGRVDERDDHRQAFLAFVAGLDR